MKRMSVWTAIAVGTLWVNIPIVPIMMIPNAIYVFIKTEALTNMARPMSHGELFVLLALIGVGFCMSWLWWSINVPKWRLWASQRVNNIELLKARSVAVGLTWPDGHIFERTEIRSKLHRTQEEKDGKRHAAYDK